MIVITVGIETSGRTGSVCAFEGGRTLHEEVFAEGLSHGRDLAPALAKTLASAGLNPADVGLFAVSAGPGSFTGIRIGAAFARVAAMFTGARTAGVSSLEALAASCPFGGTIMPVIDAGWGMVYAAAFMKGLGLNRLSGDSILAPADLASSAPRGAALFGSGAEAYRSLFEPGFEVREGEFRIKSSCVAAIAEGRSLGGNGDAPLELRYLKPWGPPAGRNSEVRR